MTHVANTVTAARIERGADQSDGRLERLLRRQQVLAWVLSTATLIVTVAFFAMMTLAAPLLARIVLGHSITLATVAAAGIILSYLAAIVFFGFQSSRIDELRRLQGEP